VPYAPELRKTEWKVLNFRETSIDHAKNRSDIMYTGPVRVEIKFSNAGRRDSEAFRNVISSVNGMSAVDSAFEGRP
jgi:hypothetical protein